MFLDLRQKFSSDWVTEHSKLWNKFLYHLSDKPGVYGLEIGCFEGRASTWFLKNILKHPNSKLYVIDNFSKGKAKTLFVDNIRAIGMDDKVIVMCEESGSALRKLNEDSFFDFIYVDGDHTAFGTLRDLVLSWELLKVGGIMIIDDYKLKDKFSFPKPGIDAFMSVVKDSAEVLHKDKQVIMRRK